MTEVFRGGNWGIAKTLSRKEGGTEGLAKKSVGSRDQARLGTASPRARSLDSRESGGKVADSGVFGDIRGRISSAGMRFPRAGLVALRATEFSLAWGAPD